MSFRDLLTELTTPGPDGVREGIYDDLSNAYTSVETDYNGLMESSSAKVSELTAKLAELETTINALKAQNFDLLMQVPSETTPNEVESAEDSGDDGETESGIDDLFEESN